MNTLICLIIRHQWRPAGFYDRVCTRCGRIEEIVR